jgi:dihydroorotase
MLQAMRYARTFDLPLWLRPVEDTLAGSGVAAAGPVAGRLGLPSIPVVAETVALHTIFELQRASGARVHICRLSSAAGRAGASGQARRSAVPPTSPIHRASGRRRHCFRSSFSSIARSVRDRDAIVAGLADTIEPVPTTRRASRRSFCRSAGARASALRPCR